MPDNSNTKVILLVYLIQLSCLSILWPSRDCFKCPFVRSEIISHYSIVKLNLDNFACLLNSLTSIYNRFYVYFILVQRLFFLYTTMYIFKSAYSCEDLIFFVVCWDHHVHLWVCLVSTCSATLGVWERKWHSRARQRKRMIKILDD